MEEFIVLLISLAINVGIWWLIIRGIRAAVGKKSGRGKPVVQKQTFPQKNLKAGKTEPVKNPTIGEGESVEEHAAHLMRASGEGESEEEHAEHLRAADMRVRETEEARLQPRRPRIDSNALRQSVITREILDPPLALRDDGFGDR